MLLLYRDEHPDGQHQGTLTLVPFLSSRRSSFLLLVAALNGVVKAESNFLAILPKDLTWSWLYLNELDS